jgi:hypothetical protein
MAKTDRRYFAQVGTERIEVDADHVELIRKGAAFSTSGTVLLYLARAVVDGTSYEGASATSFDEADDALAAQLPKGK